MAYTMNTLSGFLQIGPHYFPDRPDGAQIIMRGPHGQRLAADPVFLRSHDQPRGSGFRFWHEELNVKPDVKWNPQQVVTGVMGLGDLPAGWECPYTRSQLAHEITKIESAVQVANTPESLEAVRAQKERLLECHLQLGENQKYKGQRDRIINVGNLILLKKGKVGPGVVNPGTGRYRPQTQAEYCRQNPAACRDVTAPCPSYLGPICDAGDWIKANWWKVALGVGAVIVLSGGAKGFGAGLAKRL
jgi:hypothetical protein